MSLKLKRVMNDPQWLTKKANKIQDTYFMVRNFYLLCACKFLLRSKVLKTFRSLMNL